MCFCVDNTEVSPQQSYSLSFGEEGRRRRSFCCAVGGTEATRSIWTLVYDPLFPTINNPFNFFPSFHGCLVVSYDASCMFFVLFEICLKTLKENLSLVTAERAEGDDEEETLTNVKDSLNDIIALCHQSSQSLNQQQREVLGEHEEQPNNVVHKSYSLCPPPRSCGFHCWRP